MQIILWFTALRYSSHCFPTAANEPEVSHIHRKWLLHWKIRWNELTAKMEVQRQKSKNGCALVSQVYRSATCVENEQKVIVYRCECKYSYCYTYFYYSWCEWAPLPQNTSSGITDKTRCMFAHTVGKISIEHITIFPSKCISKCAVDMTFSPDVGNNPSSPYIQRKQNKYVQKLSHV